ncbi:Uncharacterised protein [Corynebacterium cystitidis]|nr:Uncharacterised protein [Corynebacterium cystitidis]
MTTPNHPGPVTKRNKNSNGDSDANGLNFSLRVRKAVGGLLHLVGSQYVRQVCHGELGV